MSYTQLTQEQRYQIYALLKIGHNGTEIASVLGSHKSTISRELRRNCGHEGIDPNRPIFWPLLVATAGECVSSRKHGR